MTRNLGVYVAACLSVVLAVATGSCASTKSAKTETKDERPWNPDYEIEAYLFEDEAEAVVKVRPADWDRVQPLVSSILSASVGGSALEEWSSAAERGPDELVGEMLGLDLSLEHLNRDRPSYLIFAPRRHNPWQACLSAGLPCVLFEGPGPRYGRLILPALNAGKLADELEEALGEGNYRLVEMQYHVRVEFALTNVQTDSIDQHLDVRVKDEPEDDFYGRRSPARASLVESDSPFGVYVDLRAAVDTAMYFEAWELLDLVQNTPKSERMRTALSGTAAISRLTHLDMPNQAETEDVALTFQPTDGTPSIQLVSTRTSFGEEIAEARKGNPELAEPQVENAALSVEWNAQLPSAAERVDSREWLTSDEAKHYPTSEQLGEWLWVGGWRAPSAVWTSLAERFRRVVGGSDLSKIVAGRLRMAPLDGEGSVGWNTVRGGASLLLKAESPSDALVGAFREVGEYVGPVRTEVVERSDGRIEIQFAVNSPLDEVFPEDGPSSDVERFAVEASSKGARRLSQFVGRYGDTIPVTARVVAGLAEQAPLRVSQTAHSNWSRVDVTFGDAEPADFEAPEFELRQPTRYCLDSVAQRSANWMERAGRSDEIDSHLADRFREEGSAYRSAIENCAGKDTAESELANWSLDYLRAWRALTQYRTGAEKWGKEVLEVCEEGREWACGIEEGEWPWIRPDAQ